MNRLTPISALIAVLIVGACGNQTDKGSVVKTAKTVKALVKSTFRRRASAEPATPIQTQLAEAITNAMASTDKPLAIAIVENRDGFAVLTEVARNSGYSTWASADKRTITTKNGMITATRGLGADLMSANIASSLAAVSARKSQNTQRSLNLLDGENRTVTTVFSCTVTTGGTQKIAIGEISSSVISVTEACKAEGVQFENSYQVSPSGQILQSRQWLGALNGYVFIQALRQ